MLRPSHAVCVALCLEEQEEVSGDVSGDAEGGWVPSSVARIERLRERLGDKAIERWPAHVNIVWPFASALEPEKMQEGAAADIVERVRRKVTAVLSGEVDAPRVRAARGRSDRRVRTFSEIRVRFADFGSFDHGTGTSTVFLHPTTNPPEALTVINSALEKEFPEFDDLSRRGGDKGFQAHCTLGQVRTRDVATTIESLKSDWTPIEFELRAIQIMTRPANGRFTVFENVRLPRPQGASTNAVSLISSAQGDDDWAANDNRGSHTQERAEKNQPSRKVGWVDETVTPVAQKPPPQHEHPSSAPSPSPSVPLPEKDEFTLQLSALHELFSAQMIGLTEFDARRRAVEAERLAFYSRHAPAALDVDAFDIRPRMSSNLEDLCVRSTSKSTTDSGLQSPVTRGRDTSVEDFAPSSGARAREVSVDDFAQTRGHEFSIDDFVQPSGGMAQTYADDKEADSTLAGGRGKKRGSRLHTSVDSADPDGMESDAVFVDAESGLFCIICASSYHTEAFCQYERGTLRVLRNRFLTIDGCTLVFDRAEKKPHVPLLLSRKARRLAAGTTKPRSEVEELPIPTPAAVVEEVDDEPAVDHMLLWHQNLLDATRHQVSVGLGVAGGFVELGHEQQPTTVFLCRDEVECFFCPDCQLTQCSGSWRCCVVTSEHPGLQRDICLSCLVWLVESDADYFCEEAYSRVRSLQASSDLLPHPDFAPHLEAYLAEADSDDEGDANYVMMGNAAQPGAEAAAAAVAGGKLTAGMLQDFPKNEQNRLLGEHLYPMIHATHPELCGKITGMILESCDVEEMIRLIDDSSSLQAKVAEALEVLREMTQIASTRRSAR